MKKDRIYGLMSLVACALMMMAAAARKDGRLLGHDLVRQPQAEQAAAAPTDTVRALADGSMVISTEPLARDVKGYAGEVPLEITVKDGKVAAIKALPNSETPDFFNRAAKGLLGAWNGKTLDEASQMQIDAVTGATYSSKAIIGNVKRGLQFAQKQSATPSGTDWADLLTAKFLAGLIVALMAAILPLVVKNKTYRTVQLVLNVAVLGLWGGTFVSYSSMMGFLSGGLSLPAMLVPAVLLVTAFVYPLALGKKSYYCANVCPLGSLQQLASRCSKRKIQLSPAWLHRLDWLRRGLWAALMLCMWSGLWMDWINYELFAAFIFQSASTGVLVAAAVVAVLSAFITRPYCRFVCPTGTLLKLSQNSK